MAVRPSPVCNCPDQARAPETISTPINASHVQYARFPRRISSALPRVKLPNSRMLSTNFLCGIKVEEPRNGIQFLFQDQHSLVFDDVADFTIGVEDIAELARPHRADFDAGRVAPGARSLNAEGALLHYALRAWAVAQVMGIRVELARWQAWFGPIEMARAIRARGHAVAAADAPVVIDDNDSVFLRPRRTGRAHLGARGVLTLLTAHRDVEMAFFRNLRGMVISVCMREVHALVLLHGEHANPLDLRVARLVVLRHAGIDAAPTADAARDIQGISEVHPLCRPRVGHLDV